VETRTCIRLPTRRSSRPSQLAIAPEADAARPSAPDRTEEQLTRYCFSVTGDLARFVDYAHPMFPSGRGARPTNDCHMVPSQSVDGESSKAARAATATTSKAFSTRMGTAARTVRANTRRDSYAPLAGFAFLIADCKRFRQHPSVKQCDSIVSATA
jgi:hypothetical protein